MKILGIQFSDDETMESVMNELKRRGINPNNKIIPILYGHEKVRIQKVDEIKNKSAQDFIEEVSREL